MQLAIFSYSREVKVEQLFPNQVASVFLLFFSFSCANLYSSPTITSCSSEILCAPRLLFLACSGSPTYFGTLPPILALYSPLLNLLLASSSLMRARPLLGSCSQMASSPARAQPLLPYWGREFVLNPSSARAHAWRAPFLTTSSRIFSPTYLPLLLATLPPSAPPISL